MISAALFGRALSIPSTSRLGLELAKQSSFIPQAVFCTSSIPFSDFLYGTGKCRYADTSKFQDDHNEGRKETMQLPNFSSRFWPYSRGTMHCKQNLIRRNVSTSTNIEFNGYKEEEESINDKGQLNYEKQDLGLQEDDEEELLSQIQLSFERQSTPSTRFIPPGPDKWQKQDIHLSAAFPELFDPSVYEFVVDYTKLPQFSSKVANRNEFSLLWSPQSMIHGIGFPIDGFMSLPSEMINPSHLTNTIKTFIDDFDTHHISSLERQRIEKWKQLFVNDNHTSRLLSRISNGNTSHYIIDGILTSKSTEQLHSNVEKAKKIRQVLMEIFQSSRTSHDDELFWNTAHQLMYFNDFSVNFTQVIWFQMTEAALHENISNAKVDLLPYYTAMAHWLSDYFHTAIEACKERKKVSDEVKASHSKRFEGILETLKTDYPQQYEDFLSTPKHLPIAKSKTQSEFNTNADRQHIRKQSTWRSEPPMINKTTAARHAIELIHSRIETMRKEPLFFWSYIPLVGVLPCQFEAFVDFVDIEFYASLTWPLVLRSLMDLFEYHPMFYFLPHLDARVLEKLYSNSSELVSNFHFKQYGSTSLAQNPSQLSKTCLRLVQMFNLIFSNEKKWIGVQKEERKTNRRGSFWFTAPKDIIFKQFKSQDITSNTFPSSPESTYSLIVILSGLDIPNEVSSASPKPKFPSIYLSLQKRLTNVLVAHMCSPTFFLPYRRLMSILYVMYRWGHDDIAQFLLWKCLPPTVSLSENARKNDFNIYSMIKSKSYYKTGGDPTWIHSHVSDFYEKVNPDFELDLTSNHGKGIYLDKHGSKKSKYHFFKRYQQNQLQNQPSKSRIQDFSSPSSSSSSSQSSFYPIVIFNRQSNLKYFEPLSTFSFEGRKLSSVDLMSQKYQDWIQREMTRKLIFINMIPKYVSLDIKFAMSLMEMERYDQVMQFAMISSMVPTWIPNPGLFPLLAKCLIQLEKLQHDPYSKIQTHLNDHDSTDRVKAESPETIESLLKNITNQPPFMTKATSTTSSSNRNPPLSIETPSTVSQQSKISERHNLSDLPSPPTNVTSNTQTLFNYTGIIYNILEQMKWKDSQKGSSSQIASTSTIPDSSSHQKKQTDNNETIQYDDHDGYNEAKTDKSSQNSHRSFCQPWTPQDLLIWWNRSLFKWNQLQNTQKGEAILEVFKTKLKASPVYISPSIANLFRTDLWAKIQSDMKSNFDATFIESSTLNTTDEAKQPTTAKKFKDPVNFAMETDFNQFFTQLKLQHQSSLLTNSTSIESSTFPNSAASIWAIGQVIAHLGNSNNPEKMKEFLLKLQEISNSEFLDQSNQEKPRKAAIQNREIPTAPFYASSLVDFVSSLIPLQLSHKQSISYLPIVEWVASWPMPLTENGVQKFVLEGPGNILNKIYYEKLETDIKNYGSQGVSHHADQSGDETNSSDLKNRDLSSQLSNAIKLKIKTIHHLASIAGSSGRPEFVSNLVLRASQQVEVESGGKQKMPWNPIWIYPLLESHGLCGNLEDIVSILVNLQPKMNVDEQELAFKSAFAGLIKSPDVSNHKKAISLFLTLRGSFPSWMGAYSTSINLLIESDQWDDSIKVYDMMISDHFDLQNYRTASLLLLYLSKSLQEFIPSMASNTLQPTISTSKGNVKEYDVSVLTHRSNNPNQKLHKNLEKMIHDFNMDDFEGPMTIPRKLSPESMTLYAQILSHLSKRIIELDPDISNRGSNPPRQSKQTSSNSNHQTRRSNKEKRYAKSRSNRLSEYFDELDNPLNLQNSL